LFKETLLETYLSFFLEGLQDLKLLLEYLKFFLAIVKICFSILRLLFGFRNFFRATFYRRIVCTGEWA